METPETQNVCTADASGDIDNIAWRPWGNDVPRDGRLFFLLDEFGRRHLAYWHQEWNWKRLRIVRQWQSLWRDGENQEVETVNATHWYPLPEALEVAPTPSNDNGS